MPVADAPRSVPRSEYLLALKVCAAFDGQCPKDGFEFVRVLPGFGAGARAAAQWACKLGASDKSGGAPQNFVVALGSLQEEVRRAVFRSRLFARKVQRWHICLGLKMRARLLSPLGRPVCPWEIGCSARRTARGPLNCRAKASVRKQCRICEKRQNR